MEGMAYSLLCAACNEQHDPGLKCEQAAPARYGRCEACGFVHGRLNCEEVRAVLARTFNPPRPGDTPDGPA